MSRLGVKRLPGWLRRAALGWIAPVVVGVLVVGAVSRAPWFHPPLSVDRGPGPWGLPERAAARIRAAHLPAYKKKGDAQTHPHVHLDLFVDGQPMAIPADLGQTPPWSAIHTHSTSGIIHVETSDAQAKVTLGQLFTVWGVRLDADCLGGYCRPSTDLRAYVDGVAWNGQLPALVLAPYREIAIVIGAPPATIPARYDCHDAAPMEMASCQGFIR